MEANGWNLPGPKKISSINKMIAEITKIIPYKKSQTEGVYLQIEMREIKTGKWFRTFICPMYRNFRRWQRIARVGNEIFFRTLKMKTDDIIDADSFPLLMTGRKRDRTEPVKPLTVESLAKMKVFG